MSEISQAEVKKNRLAHAFDDKRFVVFISVILSFLCWYAVTLDQVPQADKDFYGIKIPLESTGTASDMKLKAYLGSNLNDYTLDIKITGTKYIVQQKEFTDDDFIVKVNMSYVNHAGNYELDVSVDLKEKTNDYSISSYAVKQTGTKKVNLYFDEEATLNIKLEPKIIEPEGGITPDGYITQPSILAYDNVSVVGPSLEINQIDKIYAQVTLDKQITNTVTKEATLAPYAKNNNPLTLEFTTFNFQSSGTGALTPTVTIPIKKIISLPVTVNMTNAPLWYSANTENQNAFAISFQPQNLKVAVTPEAAETMTSILLGNIDFSAIDRGRLKFTFKTSDIKNITLLDDTADEVTVSIDSSAMRSITPDVDITNAYEFKNNVTDIGVISLVTKKVYGVKLIGPEDTLDGFDPAKLYAVIDFTDVTLKKGSNTVNAIFYAKDVPGVWCYGKYEVEIKVE